MSRIALGALILTAWDLALDPAMSHAAGFWVWEVQGAYYGMPWVNLAEWLFTSVLLMGGMVALGAESWAGRLPKRWMVLFYGTNVGLSLGLVAAAGLVWALLVPLGAYLALWMVARAWNRHLVAEPARAT